MDENAMLVNSTSSLGSRWWALLLRGAAAILFGVLAIVLPGRSLEVLVYLFGAYAIISGLFGLVLSAQRGRMGLPWGWWLFEGLLSIAAGVVTFGWPGITALALLVLIGIWAIVTGITEMAAAFRIRSDHAWMVGMSGVFSILLGVLLLSRPGPGALTVVWLIGFYAIVYGILQFGLGLRVRRWRAEVQRPSPTGGTPTFA
jgi:uncharacterized membrane protein HdeD (DUF308 family)